MIHSLIQAVRDFVTAPRRLREAEDRAADLGAAAARWQRWWGEECRYHAATRAKYDAYRAAVQRQDTPTENYEDEMEALVAELGIETHMIPLDRKYDFRAVSKIDGEALTTESGTLSDLKSFEARWAGDSNVSVEWREAS